MTVRTNRDSTLLRFGMTANVKLLPPYIEIWSEGRMVARHERWYQSQESARPSLIPSSHVLTLTKPPGQYGDNG